MVIVFHLFLDLFCMKLSDLERHIIITYLLLLVWTHLLSCSIHIQRSLYMLYRKIHHRLACIRCHSMRCSLSIWLINQSLPYFDLLMMKFSRHRTLCTGSWQGSDTCVGIHHDHLRITSGDLGIVAKDDRNDMNLFLSPTDQRVWRHDTITACTCEWCDVCRLLTRMHNWQSGTDTHNRSTFLKKHPGPWSYV